MTAFVSPIRTQMKIHCKADSKRNLELALPVFNALTKLMAASQRGVRPAALGTPNPAKTIRELRKKGLMIETRRANNPDGGQGLDLRYVLLSAVSFTAFTRIEEYRYAL